jgi:glycosyltransferase involved in cell wall biosynthesis
VIPEAGIFNRNVYLNGVIVSNTTISAYLITRDEEKNIARAIESVRWMDEIVVLDSGSVDSTAEIARRLGAKVYDEPFRGFMAQKNRAMELCGSEWTFNIDADEEVTPMLRESIERSVVLPRGSSPDWYEVNRKTWYMGRWIRHCGWYPEYRARLCRKGVAQWAGETLHEHLEGEGRPGRLDGELLHRPYADLGVHVKRIDRYSDIWAGGEFARGRMARPDQLITRPIARFLKMYVLKAGFLDGAAGFIASMMGAWYAFMKYARLYERSRGSG